MTTETEIYETSSIYEAAYLVLAGCLMTTKRVGHRTLFCFTNPAGSLMELRQAFVNDTARVPPHAFSTKLMALKSLCFPDGDR